MDGTERADALTHAVERLEARYGEVVAPETIRGVFDQCHERISSGATVTPYLTVLTERAAAARLDELASHRRG